MLELGAFVTHSPRAHHSDEAPALSFDEPFGFASVLMFVQIDDGHIRAFLREENRDRSADSAIPAGDQRDFVPQLSAADVIAGPGFRPGAHFVFAAGLPFLMLRRAKFLLFRYRKNHSIFDRSPDVSVDSATKKRKNLHFFEKNRFSRLTVIWRWLTCRPRLKRDSRSRKTKRVGSRLFWDCKLELNFVPA
jgi:hypothetical protein